MDKSKVSVIVPILNEEKYIEKFLDSVLNQDYPKEYLEIILVDGFSDDSTVKIIEKYIQKYDFMKLYKNVNKTVQYALNIGISNSTGKYIVRMDAHAQYSNNYISKCIEYIEKTNSENVGGPTIVKGFGGIQSIIAAAYSSGFALGGSNHYKKDFEGYTNTVSWGCFKRDYLLSIGMYDERLPRSEDDDLNFRINKSGGKIYITPEIKSVYYPKENFTKLFKQYYNYGVWKVAVTKKHRKPLKLIHLIPMAFTVFLISFGVLSLFSNIALFLFLSGVSLYFFTNLYFSFKNEHTKTLKDKLLLMWTHFVIHLSYGLGFCTGIFKFWNTKW